MVVLFTSNYCLCKDGALFPEIPKADLCPVHNPISNFCLCRDADLFPEIPKADLCPVHISFVPIFSNFQNSEKSVAPNSGNPLTIRDLGDSSDESKGTKAQMAANPVEEKSEDSMALRSMAESETLNNSLVADPKIQNLHSLSKSETAKNELVENPKIQKKNELVADQKNQSETMIVASVGHTNSKLPSPPKIIPIRKGDLVSLKLPDEYCAARSKIFENTLIGRTIYSKGDKPFSVDLLSQKLKNLWKLSASFRIISIGKGYFNLMFQNDSDWEKVWSRRTWSLSPGLLRLQQWVQDFNPEKVKKSFAQVWMRIYDLGCEFWEPELLSGIARAAGTPLRIDSNTLHGCFGYYARVLVEVDLSKPLTEKMLFQRKDISSFIRLSYENTPDFCSHCNSVGHSMTFCRRLNFNKQGRDQIANKFHLNAHLYSGQWIAKIKQNNPQKKRVHPTVRGADAPLSSNNGPNLDGKSVQNVDGQTIGAAQLENKFASLGDLDDDDTSFVADSQQNDQNAAHSFKDESVNVSEKAKGEYLLGESGGVTCSDFGPVEALQDINKEPAQFVEDHRQGGLDQKSVVEVSQQTDDTSFVADSQQTDDTSFVADSQQEDHNAAHSFNKESIYVSENVRKDSQMGESGDGNSGFGPLEALQEINKPKSVVEDSQQSGYRNKENVVSRKFPHFGSLSKINGSGIFRKAVRNVPAKTPLVAANATKSPLQKALDELAKDGMLQDFVISDSLDSNKFSNMNTMAKMSWADKVGED